MGQTRTPRVQERARVTNECFPPSGSRGHPAAWRAAQNGERPSSRLMALTITNAYKFWPTGSELSEPVRRQAASVAANRMRRLA